MGDIFFMVTDVVTDYSAKMAACSCNVLVYVRPRMASSPDRMRCE